MPPLGGAVAARPGGEYLAAEPGVGDLLIQLADPLIQLASVEAFTGQRVPVGLCLGPVGDRGPLVLRDRVRVDDRFVIEVPALAALRGAQNPGPASSWAWTRLRGLPQCLNSCACPQRTSDGSPS